MPGERKIHGKSEKYGQIPRQAPDLLWLTLTAAFLAGIGLFQYRAWQEDGVEGPALPPDALLVMEGIQAVRSVGGTNQWSLSAKQAIQGLHDDSTQLKAVRLVFADSKGGDIVISADWGTIHTNGDDMSVRSNVEVLFADATRLRTDTLSYKADTGIISSSDTVLIEAGGMAVKGLGLKIEVDERRFILEDGVRAVMQP
ncbi:MAG: LPS export ABC transporter periplasmic protein LptC [Desulfobulbaceae bacterium]|nr:LPS export ABC transporter periplasmic protein LptC [Desulfobulbaceae bacterium]